MKKLIVLIGLPASGKSTYYESIKTGFEKHIHWSRDAVVDRVAKNNKSTYDKVFKPFENIINEEFKTMSKMVRTNKPNVVVCDKTNLRTKTRDKDFIFFRENGYHITYVFFEKPVGEERKKWYKRLRNRPDKQIPMFVIEDMEQNYIDFVPEDARVQPDEIIRINNWSK